jgi:hypothetical protein
MPAQEAQRRRRQSDSDSAQIEYSDHRVLHFRQRCELNGFSEATGRRIISAGIGPIVTQLSAKRIGVTIGNNAKWQASRARKPVAA